MAVEIRQVNEDLLPLVLPLFADYQVFYKTKPNTQKNETFLKGLLKAPNEGAQFLAFDASKAVGFATLYYARSSVSAAVLGTLNDLYVVPKSRGAGVGHALMAHCAHFLAERGIGEMIWFTHTSNRTAQRLYDTFEANKDTWLQYSLKLDGKS